jgi:hypothetical protein
MFSVGEKGGELGMEGNVRGDKGKSKDFWMLI